MRCVIVTVMDTQDLLKNGYENYSHSIDGLLCVGWQRRVRDPESGATKYFVNVCEFDTESLPPLARERYRFSVEVNLYPQDMYEDALRISFTAHNRTVAEVEERCERMWVQLGCGFDPHY